MLRSSRELKKYTIKSTDGDIGKVKDLYFDEEHWSSRYLVVDTGGWLSSRKVLISPHAITAVNRSEAYIQCDLTKKQIEDSPPLASDKPISVRFEEEFYKHFKYPGYWPGLQSGIVNAANPGFIPYHLLNHTEEIPTDIQGEEAWDNHLRSAMEVIGYDVKARDALIGVVDDFEIDTQTWDIKTIVVESQKILEDHRVFIEPSLVLRISYSDSEVIIDLAQDSVTKYGQMGQHEQVERREGIQFSRQ